MYIHIHMSGKLLSGSPCAIVVVSGTSFRPLKHLIHILIRSPSCYSERRGAVKTTRRPQAHTILEKDRIPHISNKHFESELNSNSSWKNKFLIEHMNPMEHSNTITDKFNLIINYLC